jgi:hypothetical protein
MTVVEAGLRKLATRSSEVKETSRPVSPGGYLALGVQRQARTVRLSIFRHFLSCWPLDVLRFGDIIICHQNVHDT